MGGAVSHFFQSGSALLTAGNHRGCSDATRARVRTVFDALRANPRVTVQRLEGLLSQIPKVSIFLYLHYLQPFVIIFIKTFPWWSSLDHRLKILVRDSACSDSGLDRVLT